MPLLTVVAFCSIFRELACGPLSSHKEQTDESPACAFSDPGRHRRACQHSQIIGVSSTRQRLITSLGRECEHPLKRWVKKGEGTMPKVRVNEITMNYDQQGTGEPLILIPYLAADYACYAFQVAEYAKHLTCISVDLRGAGETDKPAGTYSTELYADDIAAFMQTIGIPQAHVAGLSLGAATGMWLAAKYPDKVKSLSLHSA